MTERTEEQKRKEEGRGRGGSGAERVIVVWAGGIRCTWSTRVIFEGFVDAEVRVRAKRRGRLDGNIPTW